MQHNLDSQPPTVKVVFYLKPQSPQIPAVLQLEKRQVISRSLKANITKHEERKICLLFVRKPLKTLLKYIYVNGDKPALLFFC